MLIDEKNIIGGFRYARFILYRKITRIARSPCHTHSSDRIRGHPFASPRGRVVVRINDVEARCKQVIFPINDLVLPNVAGRCLIVVFPANRLDNPMFLCYNVSRISENIILRKNTLWRIGYGQNFLRKGLFEGSQKR